MRRWCLVVVGALTAVLVAGCGGSGQKAAHDEARPASVPTVLIVDASGSMTEADAPGPRMDAAKRAAKGLIDGLPDGAVMSLLTYGTSTGSADAEKAAGCQDVKVLIPLGPLDRGRMQTQIDGLTASGYTPISLALTTAVGQLPGGDQEQAIVLVSDGEDTCDTPPCETAGQIKAAHPNLTISTVGFKTEGVASDQLRCIAAATGGIFVQADNANQLAARLLATQNLAQAQNSLSGSGFGGIELGDKLGDIRKAHPDFPDASTSGEVRVVYVDCDYVFVDGVLDSIEPHGGGRTIDGVVPGTALSRVSELYGDPVLTESDGHGGYRLTYRANAGTDAGYRVVVQDFSESGGTVLGTVKTIVLCRCAPKAGPAPQPGPQAASGGDPEKVVLKPVNARGDVQPGWFKDTKSRYDSIDCSDGTPSPFAMDSGVVQCFPNAAGAYACWPTAGGNYALCLVDPFTKTLTLYAVDKGSASPRPLDGPPRPLGVLLDDGTQCRAVVGGSWGPRGAPDFVCGSGSPFLGIWGFDAARGGAVQVGDETGPSTPHLVKSVYYVGMA